MSKFVIHYTLSSQAGIVIINNIAPPTSAIIVSRLQPDLRCSEGTLISSLIKMNTLILVYSMLPSTGSSNVATYISASSVKIIFFLHTDYFLVCSTCCSAIMVAAIQSGSCQSVWNQFFQCTKQICFHRST